MNKCIVLAFISLITLNSCDLDDPTLPIDIDEIIVLKAVDQHLKEDQTLVSVPADSVSSRLILIKLNQKTDADQKVTLLTTRGVLTKAGERPSSLSTGSLTLTAGDRTLLVQLHALDKIDSAVTVSATVGNVTNVLQFMFYPSFPTMVEIQPSTTEPAKTDEVRVTVNLRTDIGVVSEGLNIIVKDSITNGVLIDHPSFITVKNQKATISIRNVKAIVGKVYLRVAIPKSVDKSKTPYKLVYSTREVSIDYK